MALAGHSSRFPGTVTLVAHALRLINDVAVRRHHTFTDDAAIPVIAIVTTPSVAITPVAHADAEGADLHACAPRIRADINLRVRRHRGEKCHSGCRREKKHPHRSSPCPMPL